ncbi:hypothetical protein [Paraburkholderia mimosarum]|uniref:hypothetical protein n=1 Tax=Paraburkholderia mimosarum TaxID=312026 RepID=UPI000418395B|nr:hypothetical protein [Paraburkholderia mimosarum]
MSTRVEFVVYGQAASKANRRRLVTIGGKSRSIKSKEALAFEKSMLQQIPPKARVRLTGPCRIALRIWYASERSDLDESVILDCLQDRYVMTETPKGNVRTLVQRGVVRNDRQFRQRVVLHGIDRANPRAEIVIEPLQAQQVALALENSFDPFELIEA